MLTVLFPLVDLMLVAALFLSVKEATVRLMDRQLTLSTLLFSSLFFAVSLILACMVLVFTTLVWAWVFKLEI